MKKTRFLTAVITALSALTAISASAYAADVIDFENGDYSFVSMASDGDASALSVETFGGSKQLKVDVKDCKKSPRVTFDINSMINENDFEKVKTVEMEVTLQSKDGKTPVGTAEGAVGTKGGSSKPAWSQTAWSTDGSKATTLPEVVQRKMILKSDKLVNGTAGTVMILFRDPCDVAYNMYVDNIKFLDRDGNTIPLAMNTAPAATEAPAEPEPEPETEPEAVPETLPAIDPEPVEAVESETEPEPVKEDAPASDADTTSSTTGNLSAIAAASAVVLSFYAVAMTRRKEVEHHRYGRYCVK